MVLGACLGFVLGIVVASLGIAAMMRSRMLEVSPSPLATVEETVAAIEKGIAAGRRLEQSGRTRSQRDDGQAWRRLHAEGAPGRDVQGAATPPKSCGTTGASPP